MVKDLFKLRKYNIQEVNKQIIQSQSNPNSARREDKKANDPSIEKINDNSQDISTTDTSHTGDIVVNDTVAHDTVAHDTVAQDAVVQDTGTADNPVILIKESQE